MKKIVLIRHGQSQWNKENRFTGWTNVDLSLQGIEEAENAGTLLKKKGYSFDVAYTSYLKRAVKTLNCVLDKMDEDWLPVFKSWRLNEKHYGFLQGMNKSVTAEKYGDKQVHIWRRSFEIAPQPLTEEDLDNPRHGPRYASVPPEYIPDTESLKDTIERVMPYWECEIFPHLMKVDNILVVAHGNSLRGIVKHLKGISDEAISDMNIPTAVPYVFEFDDNLKIVRDFYLGNPEEIKRKQEAVARQGLAK